MSLVNDMLRDLDSRRRNAPGNGIGSEKLIPASEFRAEKSGFNFSTLLVPVLVVLVVLVAVAALYVLDGNEPVRTPISVPVASSTPVAQEVTTRDPELDAAMLQEIERMSRRMQELEERNAMLQQVALQQQSVSTQVAPSQLPGTAAVSSAGGAVVDYSSAPQWSPRDWPTAQQSQAITQSSAVQPYTPQGVAIPATENFTVSTLVRSPSELSFRDSDRLQVQQALEQWQSGQRNAALQMLTQFTARNIEAHQSREMLAKLLMQQGDSIAAMEQADIGLRISPDHSGYKKVKARVLMTAGVPGDAAELLGYRPPSLVTDPEYHELLAASRLASQLYDEALLSYQALANNDPGHSRWWYGVAASMDALGRSFEAAQAYERAVQLGGLSASLSQLSIERIATIRQN
ncbi:MAG: hypothetical protein Q8L60_03885 [Gammaproteobacteria bacterium]|nr:hypothetical protein [Gammaproteobacteria bacterium]MDP2347751.1 hypothetical protein [Gammaproteobacteria bacterium]